LDELMEEPLRPGSYATLYVVRHGQTEWNLRDILQGQSDSALTQLGEKQAVQLALHLRNVHFDAIFSSDLLRARRTAEILALERKLAVKTSQLLRERNWGRYDGVQADIFRQESRDLLAKFERLSQDEQWKFKFGLDIESYEEVFGRLTSFLREVAVAYAGKTILIISHLDVLRSLLIHLGKPPLDIGNLSYAVILSDGVNLTLERAEGIRFEMPHTGH
jgi:broad specificity phosphatase PhoE